MRRRARPQMVLSPSLRKLVLSIHIALSVGWIGAVAAYIAFDVTAATAEDPERLRSAYAGMALVARNVILPLALGALLSGIVVSVGTKWGLFRHYWVVISLALTTIATAVLAVEIGTIDRLAFVAAHPQTSNSDVRALGNTLAHSIGGTVVLLVVLALNMYKPKGMTRYGWRKERDH